MNNLLKFLLLDLPDRWKKLVSSEYVEWSSYEIFNWWDEELDFEGEGKYKVKICRCPFVNEGVTSHWTRRMPSAIIRHYQSDTLPAWVIQTQLDWLKANGVKFPEAELGGGKYLTKGEYDDHYMSMLPKERYVFFGPA